MSENLPPTRVLSTLNLDGTRRVLHPKLSRGRFLRDRRIVGYALIALFVLLPRIRLAGRPAVMIDLVTREVTAFGTVFRPTDGFLLALLGISIALVVFLVTALFGRVWCGWGCPQSVYLEHVFRPIERMFGSRKVTGWRRIAMLGVFAAISFALANVFLAYFVGTDRLERWVFDSPRDHLGGFVLVMGVSALMMFDFAYFREQTCIVACPYGRLQTVLLDSQSSIVGYDKSRGEPRGKLKKKLATVPAGDCVDCGACVATCPTGIDIRDGLQMECIGCAQCIDACDVVMTKLHRAPGLIRYTSQDELAGKPRTFWRPRVIAYPILLAIAGITLVASLAGRATAQVWVERNAGASFVALPNGHVTSQLLIKIENESNLAHDYRFELDGAAAGVTLTSALPSWRAKPLVSIVAPVFVEAPREQFVHGELHVRVRVTDGVGFVRVVDATVLGPEGGVR
jgi:cytochrome c oxidase accessory protein FixG